MAPDNTSNGRITLALLGQKLDQVLCDLAEMKQAIRADDARFHALDKDVKLLDQRVVENGKDLQDHEERIENLEKLAPAMRVVIWIGGVLGVSFLGLIWALLTGTITLVVP